MPGICLEIHANTMWLCNVFFDFAILFVDRIWLEGDCAVQHAAQCRSSPLLRVKTSTTKWHNDHLRILICIYDISWLSPKGKAKISFFLFSIYIILYIYIAFIFFMSTLWSFSSGCHRPPLWGWKGSNVALSTLTRTFSSCLFSLEPRPSVLDPSLDTFATFSHCRIEHMTVHYCNDIMQVVGSLLDLWCLWLQRLILCSVSSSFLFPWLSDLSGSKRQCQQEQNTYSIWRLKDI